MAEVDFSHAKIAPASGNYNSTYESYVNLGAGQFKDSNNNYVTSYINSTFLTDQQKHFVLQFQGTFTASGTEFYIQSNSSVASWRVYNISFSSGDTFIFQIKADLICQ